VYKQTDIPVACIGAVSILFNLAIYPSTVFTILQVCIKVL